MKFLFIGEVSGSLQSHLTLFFHFALITNEIDANIFSCMLPDLIQPVRQVCEGLFSSDIISEENAMGASVKDASDWFERFLPSRVPNLQLDYLSVNFEAKWTEFHTDCDLMLNFEFVIHDSLHQATLANTGISNNDQLE